MAYAGEAFIVQIGDGNDPETFTTIGGLRANGLKLTAEAIDVSDKSSQGWSSSMAGLRRLAVDASGIMGDTPALDRLRQVARQRLAANFRILNARGDRWEGAFIVSRWEESGDYNGEHAYTFSLENAAAPVFVAG